MDTLKSRVTRLGNCKLSSEKAKLVGSIFLLYTVDEIQSFIAENNAWQLPQGKGCRTLSKVLFQLDESSSWNLATVN